MISSLPVSHASIESELDILRQMLLLSRGPADPLFRKIDDAIRSAREDKMREALRIFDELTGEEKDRHLGVHNAFDGPCTD